MIDIFAKGFVMQANGNNRFLFLIDLLGIYAFFFVVFTYYEGYSSIPFKGNLLMGIIGFLWFFISINFHVCKVNKQSQIIEVLKNTFVAFSVLSVIVIALVAIYGNFRPNDKLVLYPLLFSFLFSALLRFFYLIIIKHFIKNGYQQRSVLLIGGGHSAKKVLDHILSSPESGFRLHGVLSDDYHESLPMGFYLGKLERFSEIIRTNQIDEVIIAKPMGKDEIIIEMAKKCEKEGVRFHIVPEYFCLVKKRAVLDNLGDIPLIGIRTEPLSLLSNRIIKRTFDIILSLSALISLSPILFILAIIIKITSPGPVFFKQKRVGANNKEFEMYKLRSMVVQEKNKSDTVWTTSNDERITMIGKFMRKTNMDELPQLWNVILGNMSIVGPRPERKHFVEKFKADIPSYQVRHLVKSGITGLAQANGWRGDSSIANRVQYDLFYLENWSFWLDIKIIWKTVFNRKAWQNAY
jgi:exopolysaccharide biosynthesis polyprenyl glycosylphosphotransferase